MAKIGVTDARGNQAHLKIAAVSTYGWPRFGAQPVVRTPFLGSTPGILLLTYLGYLLLLGLFGLAWYDARIHHLRLAAIHIFPAPPVRRRTTKSATKGRR